MSTDPGRAGLLRHGRTILETLYLQSGASPAKPTEPDGDLFVGHARTAEVAELAVAAVNTGQRIPGCRWWCSGGLVYPQPGCSLTRDWIVAVNSEEIAQRIVASARGEVSGG